MRTLVQTTIIRDSKGYLVQDYGNPPPVPGVTLLGQPPSGVHILGVSGINEKIVISVGDNFRLWEKARRVSSPQSLAKFMNKWGQLTRWLNDDGTKPYSEAYILIEPHLIGLRYLASFVDAGDREGFSANLNGNSLLGRANLKIDQLEQELILEAPSLLRFMMVEIWNELGGDRSAHFGLKTCHYCGSIFQAGGRGRNKRRSGAKFCTDSCKNMASWATVNRRML